MMDEVKDCHQILDEMNIPRIEGFSEDEKVHNNGLIALKFRLNYVFTSKEDWENQIKIRTEQKEVFLAIHVDKIASVKTIYEVVV